MKTKKLDQNGFHAFYIIVFVLVLFIIAAVGYKILSNQQGGGGQANKQSGKIDPSDKFVQQYGSNCDDKPTVNFTNSPLATDQVGYIEPMGRVYDGHVTPTDHVYVSPTNMNAADNSYNVVMPADGKVVSVGAMPAQYVGDQKTTVAPEDHRVVVSFNCRYYSIFIHIHQLDQKIVNEVGKLKPNESKNTSIVLRAGDVIGKIGGSPVDWTMIDVSTTLSGFITPKLYEGEPWKIHTIDPFSVYSGNLRAQMEEKSLRSTKPLGGKIDFDRKGTLIGNWFKTGTNGYQGASQERYYDGHLSVVPNNIDPTVTMVSIGNWQGTAKQFMVKGDVNPATINKSNSPVKYELVAGGFLNQDGSNWDGRSLAKGLKGDLRGNVVGTIMFEVQDGNKLRIEKFPGKTATQVSNFTASAETYER